MLYYACAWELMFGPSLASHFLEFRSERISQALWRFCVSRVSRLHALYAMPLFIAVRTRDLPACPLGNAVF